MNFLMEQADQNRGERSAVIAKKRESHGVNDAEPRHLQHRHKKAITAVHLPKQNNRRVQSTESYRTTLKGPADSVTKKAALSPGKQGSRPPFSRSKSRKASQRPVTKQTLNALVSRHGITSHKFTKSTGLDDSGWVPTAQLNGKGKEPLIQAAEGTHVQAFLREYKPLRQSQLQHRQFLSQPRGGRAPDGYSSKLFNERKLEQKQGEARLNSVQKRNKHRAFDSQEQRRGSQINDDLTEILKATKHLGPEMKASTLIQSSHNVTEERTESDLLHARFPILDAVNLEQHELQELSGECVIQQLEHLVRDATAAADLEIKKFVYHVYPGNYPAHIEAALEKRGVWRALDVAAQETKLQTHYLNSQTPNRIVKDKHAEKVLEVRKNLAEKIQVQQELLQRAKNLQKYSAAFNRTQASPLQSKSKRKSPVKGSEVMNEDLVMKQKYEGLQKQAMANIKRYEAQLVKSRKTVKEMGSASSSPQNAKGEAAPAPGKQPVSQYDLDEAIIEKCNFVWRPINFYDRILQKRICKRCSRQNQPFVLNHFECVNSIGTKSGLIRSLKQYYYTNQQARTCSYNVFDTTPTTFIVQAKFDDDKMQELVARYKQLAKANAPKERMPLKHCKQNLWLVKPTNLNQGRGIEIFSDLDKMLSFINSKSAGSHFVVQKYIERPLLYKRRKFDIRVWALITTQHEIWFYKQGYLRTSSSQYSLDSVDQFVHLTNQCLQVKNKDFYGCHEEGNTLSFSQFQEYLDSEEFLKSRPDLKKNQRVVMERDMVPRMKDIIIDSYCAVKAETNPNRRRHHFELFGFDFMVDEDFRVWLIEVNSNPYIGTPNKFTQELIPAMVDEMLSLTLDPLYPPHPSYQAPRSPNFELIYQETQCHVAQQSMASTVERLGSKVAPLRSYNLQLVNQRRPFSTALIYPFAPTAGEEYTRGSLTVKGLTAPVRQKQKSIDGPHLNSGTQTQFKPADSDHFGGSFSKRKKSAKQNAHKLLEKISQLNEAHKVEKGGVNGSAERTAENIALNEGKSSQRKSTTSIKNPNGGKRAYTRTTVCSINKNQSQSQLQIQGQNFHGRSGHEDCGVQVSGEGHVADDQEEILEVEVDLGRHEDPAKSKKRMLASKESRCTVKLRKDTAPPEEGADSDHYHELSIADPLKSLQETISEAEVLPSKMAQHTTRAIQISINENKDDTHLPMSARIAGFQAGDSSIKQQTFDHKSLATTPQREAQPHIQVQISEKINGKSELTQRASIKNRNIACSKKHVSRRCEKEGLIFKLHQYATFPVSKKQHKAFHDIFMHAAQYIFQIKETIEQFDLHRLQSNFQQFLEADDKRCLFKPACIDKLILIAVSPNQVVRRAFRPIAINFLLKLVKQNFQATDNCYDHLLSRQNLSLLVNLHKKESKSLLHLEKMCSMEDGICQFSYKLDESKQSKPLDPIDGKLLDLFLTLSCFDQVRVTNHNIKAPLILLKYQVYFQKSLDNGLISYLLVQPSLTQKLLKYLSKQDIDQIKAGYTQNQDASFMENIQVQFFNFVIFQKYQKLKVSRQMSKKRILSPKKQYTTQAENRLDQKQAKQEKLYTQVKKIQEEFFDDKLASFQNNKGVPVFAMIKQNVADLQIDSRKMPSTTPQRLQKANSIAKTQQSSSDLTIAKPNPSIPHKFDKNFKSPLATTSQPNLMEKDEDENIMYTQPINSLRANSSNILDKKDLQKINQKMHSNQHPSRKALGFLNQRLTLGQAVGTAPSSSNCKTQETQSSLNNFKPAISNSIADKISKSTFQNYCNPQKEANGDSVGESKPEFNFQSLINTHSKYKPVSKEIDPNAKMNVIHTLNQHHPKIKMQEELLSRHILINDADSFERWEKAKQISFVDSNAFQNPYVKKNNFVVDTKAIKLSQMSKK